MECQCLSTFPTDKHGVTEGVNGRCAKKVSRGENALKEGGGVERCRCERAGDDRRVTSGCLLIFIDDFMIYDL